VAGEGEGGGLMDVLAAVLGVAFVLVLIVGVQGDPL
jgi:hypothetical protein